MFLYRIKQIYGFLNRRLPIIKNSVFFLPVGGIYYDNLKWISKKLHEISPNINIYWLCNNDNKIIWPSYISRIPINSFCAEKMEARASVVIGNGFGRTVFVEKKTDPLFKIAKILIFKRKKQLVIGTWHGTPLKHIGTDIPLYENKQVVYTDADYILAGCHYTQKVLDHAFCCAAPIKLYGTPRNDILFHKNSNIAKLKRELSIPEKNVILFAPTFRDDKDLEKEISKDFFNHIEILLYTIEQKFGGEWCLVYRSHSFSVSYKWEKTRKEEGRIINGNIGMDMAEYMVCADILLTDYSSCMFDFAITRKPCFLFAPDIDYYEKKDRGLYLDYAKLPFPKAYTIEELINQIISFNAIQYDKDIVYFLEKIGNIEDGHASERVVDDIIHFINTGEKR